MKAKWSPSAVNADDDSTVKGLPIIMAAVVGHFMRTSFDSSTGCTGCWKPALSGVEAENVAGIAARD